MPLNSQPLAARETLRLPVLSLCGSCGRIVHSDLSMAPSNIARLILNVSVHG